MAKGMKYETGYEQGNMNAKVDDYQAPSKCYSQKNDSATLDYIERQDGIRSKEASQLENQSFSGRYK
jgi:hypothetical protein